MIGVSEPQSKGRMPSDVDDERSFFDRFAGRVTTFVSRGWFFSMCVLLVVVWAPSYFLVDSIDTWQLIINTATTIVTFLMVALLQNSQSRSDAALQDKLNAVAAALAVFMDHFDEDSNELRQAREELVAAVGLEERESAH